jgi:hypothetical protein
LVLLTDPVEIYTLRLWRALSAGKVQAVPSLRSSMGLAWLLVPALSRRRVNNLQKSTMKYNIAIYLKIDGLPHGGYPSAIIRCTFLFRCPFVLLSHFAPIFGLTLFYMIE